MAIDNQFRVDVRKIAMVFSQYFTPLCLYDPHFAPRGENDL